MRLRAAWEDHQGWLVIVGVLAGLFFLMACTPDSPNRPPVSNLAVTNIPHPTQRRITDIPNDNELFGTFSTPVGQRAADGSPCHSYRVATYGANVRIGPGTHYAVQTSFGQGHDVCVIARSTKAPDWFIIEIDGERLYMHESVLSPISATSSVDSVRDAASTTVINPYRVSPSPPAQPTYAPPPPTAVPVPQQQAPCNCSGPDLDCADLGSHWAAQACYEYCLQHIGYDVFRLDGDNDGSACESW